MIATGGGVTITVTVIVWWINPPTPVMLTLKVMGVGTPAKIAMDTFELPPVGSITGLGMKITVIPVGTLLLDRVTLPVKPMLATVMTSEPDPPAGIDRDDAEALRLKSAPTVRVAQLPVAALLFASPLYDAW